MPKFAPLRARINRAISIDPPKAAASARQYNIQALPLPDISKLKPDLTKGIEGIVAIVMNPSIRDTENNGELINFDPPLELTIEYTDADAQSTTLDTKGAPKLSLALGYQDGKKWKWEKLKTRVIPNASGGGGILRAKLFTLQPADPIFLTRP